MTTQENQCQKNQLNPDSNPQLSNKNQITHRKALSIRLPVTTSKHCPSSARNGKHRMVTVLP